MSTILLDEKSAYTVTNCKVTNIKIDGSVKVEAEKPWRKTKLIVVDNEDRVVFNDVLSLVELRYWLLDLGEQFADGLIRSFMVYEKKGGKG